MRVDGYGQYCPIALGAEVFAERWTPIILRNLMMGCEHFGDILDGAPGLPRSVLSTRLRHLERDGVVERDPPFGRAAKYRLTACGHELADVVLALGSWGARWREAAPEHHDPYLMLWTLAHLIRSDSLARPRIVVRFDLTDHVRPPRYWVVASDRGNEVCISPPGFAEDGIVETNSGWLYRWHTGRSKLANAQQAGGITVTAPRWLVRVLTDWGALSPYADVQPARGG